MRKAEMLIQVRPDIAGERKTITYKEIVSEYYEPIDVSLSYDSAVMSKRHLVSLEYVVDKKQQDIFERGYYVNLKFSANGFRNYIWYPPHMIQRIVVTELVDETPTE